MLVASLLLLLAAPAAPPPNASRLTPAQLAAVVREVSADVERLRGLRFKAPVRMEVIDPKATRQRFADDLRAADLERARHAQNVYVQLGLVPPGTDLIQGYLRQAETSVLGYYESDTKRLFLSSAVPADDVRAVVAHELTHALEDQHFDFAAVGARATSDDHATAIKAVIEGSATFVMYRYLLERHDRWAAARASRAGLQRAQMVAGAPAFVQQTVVMPYVLGLSFLLKGKPWELGDAMDRRDLDAAYLEPPRSTRQILHPEQYWDSRRRAVPPPRLADLSAAFGPGWSKVSEGAIGELGLSAMTGTKVPLEVPAAFLPQSWTSAAADGSTGDLFHHYANGTRRATVLVTEWESVRDASEFAAVLRKHNRSVVDYGPTVLVLGGDVGDRLVAVATAAIQGRSPTPGRP